MAAAYRANESLRTDALFRDPFAEMLSGEHGRNILAGLPKQAFIGGWTVVIRTRIIDELIQAAIAEGVDTILNIGAGLDTRPYRMNLPPGIHWIEVDQPHVIEFKTNRLRNASPVCDLEHIGLDLTDEESRDAALSKLAGTSQNALVLTEGVIPYLSEAAVASLGIMLRSHVSFKYWITDYFSPASYDYRRRSGMSQAMKNAPFQFEPEDYFGFFKGIGWVSNKEKYFAIEAKRLRRPPPFPFPVRLIMRIAALLASPARRQQMQQYAGMVLFQPASAPG